MWLSHRLFHGDYVSIIYGFRCKQPCLKLGFELSGDICEFSMGVDSSGVLLAESCLRRRVCDEDHLLLFFWLKD